MEHCVCSQEINEAIEQTTTMKKYIKPILKIYSYLVEQGYALSSNIEKPNPHCPCGGIDCHCGHRSDCRGNNFDKYCDAKL